jgi:ArsR family transcriptional regulator
MKNKNILNSCILKNIKESEFYGAYRIFFGTLSSQSRLKIINILRKNKKLCVSDLTKKLNLDQTIVSHNLTRLKKCGFVKVEIKGKYRYYTLNEKTIKPIMELIDSHMFDYCIHILRGEIK